MPTQTGVNTASLDVFITDLVAFAVANAGFTDEGTISIGGFPVHRLSRTREAHTAHWGIYVRTASSSQGTVHRCECRLMRTLPTISNFNPSSDTTAGQRQYTVMDAFNTTPPYTGYFLFTDGDSVFGTLEVAPNAFTHIALGNVTKAGTWVGGEYLCAMQTAIDGSGFPFSNSTNRLFGNQETAGSRRSYMRYDIGAGNHTDYAPFSATRSDNTYSNIAYSATPDGPVAISSLGAGVDFINDPFNSSANTFSTNPPLFPMLIFIEDRNSRLRIRPVGIVPNIASVYISNLTPKSLINTDWRVFPYFQKAGGNITIAPDSGTFGYAFREV